jgi:hypothetical protein
VSNVRYADAYRLSFSPSPTKAGFGLGALNEAEDDDIDVYDSTTRADRTYMPYDAIRDADDGSSVNRGKLVQKVESSFFTKFLDWFLLDFYDAAAVPERSSRASWLCSLPQPRTERAMVTVSQQFVVIRLIGPDAGFRSQKCHKAGSLTLVEYGRRILKKTMLQRPHLQGQVCWERESWLPTR